MAETSPEKEVDFESFLKLPVFLFRLVLYHFDPLSATPTWAQKLKQYLMESYFCLHLGTTMCGVLMFAGYGVEHFKYDFVDSLSSVPNSNCMLLIFLKGFCTFLNRKEIWNIWQQLKVLVNQRITETGRYDMKPFYKEYIRHMKIYGYTFVGTMLPISFPIIPFVLTGRMDMPIKYWYPFNIYRKEIFFFAWLWVNFVAWHACSSLLAADSLLYALITIIVMEFDCLKHDLDALKNTKKEDKRKKVELFAQRHTKLLDLVDGLQNVYDLTFLFSFVISALIICFIAFQLSVFEADLETYSFIIPYLGMMGGQIFLLSLYGQKLIDTSVAVADGIYECGWEDVDEIEIKKYFIMIIMRAQKPARFTAMGFAEINLLKFTSIMTTTGSYFTLLKNVYSGD